MNAEAQERLVRTGPGTPGGNLQRRYWQPVGLSEDVAAGGAPMPVGRVLAVPATSKNKEAAYWVAKYLSLDESPTTVAANWSGQDPYRVSHFTDASHYKFSDDASRKDYLAATEANLKNGFPDLVVHGYQAYEGLGYGVWEMKSAWGDGFKPDSDAQVLSYAYGIAKETGRLAEALFLAAR